MTITLRVVSSHADYLTHLYSHYGLHTGTTYVSSPSRSRQDVLKGFFSTSWAQEAPWACMTTSLGFCCMQPEEMI